MSEKLPATEKKYYMPAPPPKANPAMGYVASLVGMVLGRYTGIFFIFPVILMGVAYLLYRKLIFKNKQIFFLEASVLLCGHAGWLGTGMIIIGFQDVQMDTLPLLINISECLLYLGLSYYLLKDPVNLLVLVMIALELISLVVNIFSIAQAEFGTDAHKALTVHVVIRVAILVYGGIGLKKLAEFTKKQILEGETQMPTMSP